MDSEDFFSEFYHPDEIVTENEGNEEVLSILHALPIWSHLINNLITLLAGPFCKIPDFGLKFFIYGPCPEARSIKHKNFIPQSGILQ